MLFDCGENVLGLGTPLVILRLIDPADHSIGVGEDRGGNGLPRNARWPHIDPLVSQSVEIRNFELSVGEHDGPELVLAVPRTDLRGGIGAHGQDLNLALVEFGPELLPSPQLGDAVGSPMAAKELQENRLARNACDRNGVTVLIESGEISQALAHSNCVAGDPLSAHVHERNEEGARHCGDAGGNAADPTRVPGQGENAEHRTAGPAGDETPAIRRNLNAFHSLGPPGHRSGNQQKGDNTERGCIHELDTSPAAVRLSTTA